MTAAVVALARPTFDLTAAMQQVERAWHTIERAGLDIVGSPELITSCDDLDGVIAATAAVDPDVLIVLQATFADASMIIRLDERLRTPLVCWSFPEARTGRALRLNSLCGANLAAYSLRRRGSSAAFVHADPIGCDAAERLGAAIAEAHSPLSFDWPPPTVSDTAGLGDNAIGDAVDRVVATLDGAAIGVIGGHPDGFEPCAYDPVEIAELAGAYTDAIPLDTLFAAADAVRPAELAAIRRRTAGDLQLSADLDGCGLDRSLRLYGGLRELAASRGWKAVATRCWPECARDYGGAVCAPQAMLTADGIPAMCEADVYGGLTALVLRTVAGRDPFVTDVVDADRSDGTSALWHCGQASISLAAVNAPRRGISHPMQGKALLHEFPLRAGPVTIARLSRAGGRESMVIAGGELLDRPRPFAGTSGVLRWDLPVDDVMRTIFDVGLEHHFGFVAGDHRDVLVELAARWGLPVVRLGHDRGTRLPAGLLAGATDVGP